MHVIALPTDAKEAKGIFGIYHIAAAQGAGPRDRVESRTLEKLQAELEAVSHDGEPITNAKGEVMIPRLLNDGVTEIRLEDARWEMLKKRIWGAGIDWLAGASGRVNAAEDLLIAAIEEKPGETPKGEADVVPLKGKKRG
jgi:hypothetical protein